MAEGDTGEVVLNDLLGGYGSEDSSPETKNEEYAADREYFNTVDLHEEPSFAPETRTEAMQVEEEKQAAEAANGHTCDDLAEYEELMSRVPALGEEEGTRELSPVDERIQKKVDMWISIKNDKGFSIVDELRSRKLFKSPDLMTVMMDKFEIEQGGTFLKVPDGTAEQIGIAEMRALGAAHSRDVTRIQQQSRDQGRERKIEFRRGAVSAAVAAAQAKAAAYSKHK